MKDFLLQVWRCLLSMLVFGGVYLIDGTLFGLTILCVQEVKSNGNLHQRHLLGPPNHWTRRRHMVLKLIWLHNFQIICYPIKIGECIQTWNIENCVCVCAPKRLLYISWYLHLVQPCSTVDTFFQQKKPGLAPGSGGSYWSHLECQRHRGRIMKLTRKHRGKLGCYLGVKSCSTIGNAPMNLSNDWMDVDVD